MNRHLSFYHLNFRPPVFRKLSFAIMIPLCLVALYAIRPVEAQQPAREAAPINLLSIDASSPVLAPETGYLHLGGTSSTGHSLQVNSRYLVLDGKPWLPVMGELHYSRVPEAEWEDEILKMKAAGINIVSTYVFWIHHEEIAGKFDWTGRRDLRRFVELCAKHGMYVYVRPGPWAHGEVRNGGFPDWLAQQPNTRTNDPEYLHYVERFFNQIGLQLRGLMFRDGGPIIGTQLENEYGLHGPGRGAEHILKLKELAIAAGMDTPLFSVTGWPSLDFPTREVMPVSGAYPDGFWYGSETALPPSTGYLFNFNRELGDMGATVPSEDPTGKVDLRHYPYAAAEEAGGMASAYHRRPVIAPDDVAALTLTGIGSGINLYGYYMYRGGTNPKGIVSTMQESQATGFPNDLPQLTYDFGAPLGEYGQERESYRKTRMIHLFLNTYGSTLAPMTAFAPRQHSRDAADTSSARVALRCDGQSGFLFVNNYVRQMNMPPRYHFQVKLKLSTGEALVPSRPVDLPANSYFVWPIDLAVGETTLRYSTAQVLARLDTPAGKVIVFFAVPGIAPEFSFDSSGASSIEAPGATIRRTNGTISVSNLDPGMNATITVANKSGAKTTLLLLTQQQAEQTSLVHIGESDHLALTASSIIFDGQSIHLRSTASPVQHIALLPGLDLAERSKQTVGLWTTFTLTQPEQHPVLQIVQTQTAQPGAKMDMGPYFDWRKRAVATTPSEIAFERASSWELKWKNPNRAGLSNEILKLEYVGDIARLYSASTLLEDDFFNGVPWEVGLKDLSPEVLAAPLTLKVLPLPVIAPIYLEPDARKQIEENVLTPKLARASLVPEYESLLATQ